jgi:hypothetical protein
MQALWTAAELAAEWLPIAGIGVLLVWVAGWGAWRGVALLRETTMRPGQAGAAGPTMRP